MNFLLHLERFPNVFWAKLCQRAGGWPIPFAVPQNDYTGAPYKTQGTVRAIQDQIWSNTPAGLADGNDDLGAMSAWYVWSALGMFPQTPGTADLALGSPLFPQAVIALPSGVTLTVNEHIIQADIAMHPSALVDHLEHYTPNSQYHSDSLVTHLP